MIIKKYILFFISILFVILSITLLIVSEEKQTNIIALLSLLFFAGGAVVFYILSNTFYDNTTKNIASILGTLIFTITSYFILPFNHLFDESRKYNPTIAWIIGITGIISFGFSFFRLITKLLKENDRNRN
ncbi:hypothetical protein HX001_04905 [Empedobacter brevis]|uniref:Uncharacterized protein n=1 Tax=Empedobacter brevis TaxID=247 RepID=A0AAJ1QD27_9FLAO|nr:hypothetical protein [Empedobacter brevis]MDM1071833.1 hypothetical protein [Empedobacter brevis]QHC86053.1 hypothetical protein AS589_15290 [Empedobacter brevis]